MTGEESGNLPSLGPTPVQLTETELALVAVLQRVPRLPWSRVGPLVGLSAHAASLLWESLVERNLAWATLQHSGRGPNQVTAFLGLNHTPTLAGQVQEALIRSARIQSIDYFAQGRDLILTAVAPSLAALVRDVVDPVRAIEGVSAMRTWLVTDVHAAGYSQPLPVRYGGAQLEELAEHHPQPAARSEQMGPHHLAIIAELMVDGRISVTELARRIGLPLSTTHRYLGAVLSSSSYHIRVNIAAGATSHPATCQWFARLPGDRHAAAVARLRELPNLRLAASVTGHANFVLAVGLSSVSDVLSAEHAISSLVPDITLMESLVTLQTLKRWGWELDEAGRRTGLFVRPPLW